MEQYAHGVCIPIDEILIMFGSQVVTLTKERAELEGRVLPVQSELDSLRGRYSEAEKVRHKGLICLSFSLYLITSVTAVVHMVYSRSPILVVFAGRSGGFSSLDCGGKSPVLSGTA